MKTPKINPRTKRRIQVAVLTLALCVGIPGSARAESDTAAWPAFRGASGNGHAVPANSAESGEFPLHWSETSNVTWKIPIPHQGWSTPVMMGGRLWLTTASEAGNAFYVIGVDTNTGDIFVNQEVFHSDDPEPLGNNINGYASPTSAIEPGRLYVNFGSYGTACIDTDSYAVLWKREDIECRHFRGPGSSVLLFEDLVVLTFDGVDVQYLTALDKRTGETVWRTDRSTVWNDLDENGQPKRQGDFRKGFSTPAIAEVGGKPLLISVASSACYGYDPYTGREIWNITDTCHTPSASPLVHGEIAYIATGFGTTELRAIRLDGEGDVTDSHIAWRLAGKQAPNTPSPILVDGLLYVVSDRGIVTCLEADTGAEVWSERIGGNYMASPIYAGGRLYFSSLQGKTTVIGTGRTFNLLATNQLDGDFRASPAIARNALYLRSKTHLYRIDTGRR